MGSEEKNPALLFWDFFKFQVFNRMFSIGEQSEGSKAGLCRQSGLGVSVHTPRGVCHCKPPHWFLL